MICEKIKLEELLEILKPQIEIDIQYCLDGHFKSSGIYSTDHLKNSLEQTLLDSTVNKIQHGTVSLIIQLDSLEDFIANSG